MNKKSGLADSPFFKPPETEAVTRSPITANDRSSDGEVTYKATQKSVHLRERLRNPIRKPAHIPTSEAIERMSFTYRKVRRVRVCGDVPPEWKKRLVDLAYQLQVGRYELVMYIIGRFLGEVAEEGQDEGEKPEAAQQTAPKAQE